jgi:hypothetical protein
MVLFLVFIEIHLTDFDKFLGMFFSGILAAVEFKKEKTQSPL